MPRVPLPGSLVWLRQRRWRVDRTRVDRRVVRLDVSSRSGALTVLTPYDQPRVLAPDRRPVRVRRQQGLARLAVLLGTRVSARLVHTALDAHVQLWPHQLAPVLAILDGQRRLLIADDVGLGKTIQAGLILAELRRRQPDLSALLITPASLRHQWSEELHSRFGISACPTDEALDIALARGRRGTHPWCRPGVWITSIDYLKQRHVLDGLPHAPWDLVVVDEAHIATGHSDRHAVCDELGRRARHLVLLSATPHDGDAARFARLLRLGALPYAGDSLAIFRRTRVDVGWLRHRAVRWTRIVVTPALARLLDALLSFEQLVLRDTSATSRDAALLLLSVYRKRALSTMAAFDRSLVRRLEWLDTSSGGDRPEWVQPGLAFDDDIDDHDRTGLSADLGLPRARERAWLRRLRVLVAAAAAHEPKLSRLQAFAARTAEPFVLFTEFRHSLEEVYRVLAPIRSVAVIHGGQSEQKRRTEIARFLSADASVLIATDVGSQGLNLQTRARWVINLELPWNPTRLEQRIGRLDRLGQTQRVHANIFVSGHASESTLLASLAKRTLIAQRDLGASTLCDVAPPSQLAIASALLRGAALPAQSPVDATHQLCRRYNRPARAQAVVLQQRRRLLQRWKGRRPSGTRPVRTRWIPPTLPRLNETVSVVSIPFIDRTGSIVERRILVMAAPGMARPDHIHGASVDCTLPGLAASINARLRRLRRLTQASTRRRIDAQRAIARHLRALSHPSEAQLGLFSQREAVAFTEARLQAALGATASARHLRTEEGRADLTAEDGALEWIGERR